MKCPLLERVRVRRFRRKFFYLFTREDENVLVSNNRSSHWAAVKPQRILATIRREKKITLARSLPHKFQDWRTYSKLPSELPHSFAHASDADPYLGPVQGAFCFVQRNTLALILNEKMYSTGSYGELNLG